MALSPASLVVLVVCAVFTPGIALAGPEANLFADLWLAKSGEPAQRRQLAATTYGLKSKLAQYASPPPPSPPPPGNTVTLGGLTLAGTSCAVFFAGVGGAKNVIIGSVSAGTGAPPGSILLKCTPKPGGQVEITITIDLNKTPNPDRVIVNVGKNLPDINKVIRGGISKASGGEIRVTKPIVTVVVTRAPPPGPKGSVAGDPHFTGFNGKKFNFHGRGKQVLFSNQGTTIGATFLRSGPKQWKRTSARQVTVQRKGVWIAVSLTKGKTGWKFTVAGNGKVLPPYASAKLHGTTLIQAVPVVNGKVSGALITYGNLRISVYRRSQPGKPIYGQWLNVAVTVTKPLTGKVTGLLGGTYAKPAAKKAGFKAASAPAMTAVIAQ